MRRDDKKALGIILVCLTLGGLFWVGVPVVLWHFLAPIVFWQRLATLAGIAVYECFVVPLGVMVSGGIVAVFLD